ncbi:MAG: STAS domain-containing protein, partial [Myxococcales bacterium]|nr:STAS domain-containing protein [Myxococcales bacterium]
MSTDVDERMGQVVLGHITDIAGGHCSITEAEVEAEPDAALREILAGLLILHEELSFRERERAEAEGRNRELSTPILEVGRRVLLLPLVGVVDFGRSEQMVERALEGISSKGARVLVIDVTGLADIDAGVAGRIGSTIRAVGLLGARTVLTGVSPGNARMLVGMNVELEGVVIRRTLGDGLEAASLKKKKNKKRENKKK